MEATARCRLFHNRGPAAVEERRVAYRQAASAGATRRRRTRRDLGRTRLRSGSAPRRRMTVLLLVVAFGTGTIVTLRLLAFAWLISSKITDRADKKSPLRKSSVSLGPDAIPSVVVYERHSPSAASVLGPKRSAGIRKRLGLRDDYPLDEATEIVGLGGRNRGCRNTVQGVSLIADSDGRVCRRRHQDPQRPGCCATSPYTSGRSPLVEGPPPLVITDGAEGDHGLERPRVGNYRLEWRKEKLGESQLVGVDSLLESSAEGFPPDEALSRPFSCWSCDVGDGGSSCCSSFEFCVSCCQDPSRAEERETIRIAAARSGHPAYVGFDAENGAAVHTPLSHPSTRDDERVAQLRAFDLCAFRCRTHSGSVAHENSYRGPLKHCFGRFRPPVTLGVSGDDKQALPLQLDPFLSDIEGK